MNYKIFFSFLIFSNIFQISYAFAKTYDLEIKKQDVFITGKAVEAITINGSIPGGHEIRTLGTCRSIFLKTNQNSP